MKSVWGVPERWSWAASSCDMKLSVEPLSAIISAEEEKPPQGEFTGTSSSSNRLPASGREGALLEGTLLEGTLLVSALLEGCNLEALEVVRDWQNEELLPWRSWWCSPPQALPPTLTVQRSTPRLPRRCQHLS